VLAGPPGVGHNAPLAPRSRSTIAAPTRAWIDVLLFSSLWTASAAAGLVAAAGAAIGVGHPPVALALAGTWVVYNVDRLRDLERDRPAWPLRSRFVEENRAALIGLTVCAAVAAVALAIRQGHATVALCTAVLALGLLHRRLKGRVGTESAYVTGAWLAVGVGLPVLAGPLPAGASSLLPWVAGIFAGALAANALASTLCDSPGTPRHRVAVLSMAGLLVVASGGVALAAPEVLRPLIAVPVAQAFVLLFFRRDERYALGGLDGGLGLGAWIAAWLVG